MQKWEYCEIAADNVSLTYFTTAGAQTTEFGWKEQARIFAQLGEEGWEMCGVARGSFYYFKRPKL